MESLPSRFVESIYINGFDTVLMLRRQELTDAQQNVYGVGYDLAILLAVFGVGLDGDPITMKLSLGCDATSRTATPGLGPEPVSVHSLRHSAWPFMSLTIRKGLERPQQVRGRHLAHQERFLHC